MIVGVLIGIVVGLVVGVYLGVRWVAPRRLAALVKQHGMDGAETHLGHELGRIERRRQRH